MREWGGGKVVTLMEVKGREGQSLWFDASVLRVKVESNNMPPPSCLMQYGNVYRLHVYFHPNQTSFHVKGFDSF